jgi:putative addiction module killer protein
MTIEIVEYLDENDHSPFGAWFDRLPATAAAKVVVVLNRINRGLLGDVKSVGGGVSERRIDFGPGYRIYFASIKTGNVIQIVVLLGGGTKKRQNNDVEITKNRWKKYKARRRKGENYGIDEKL